MEAGIQLWDSGATAFWAAVVEPREPYRCFVPEGIELRLKGASLGSGAARGSSTVSVLSADGTSSLLARLSLGARECCRLSVHLMSGDVVLTCQGSSAVHVSGHMVRSDEAVFFHEQDAAAWPFVDGEAESESESDGAGKEEVVYTHGHHDQDGGGESDEDSLDDDTGTVDYSDNDSDDDAESALDSSPLQGELGGSKSESESESEEGGEEGESESDEEEDEEEEEEEFPLDILNRAQALKRPAPAEPASAKAKRPRAEPPPAAAAAPAPAAPPATKRQQQRCAISPSPI